MNYQKYIDSGVWRCSKSPGGAHYWTTTPGEQENYYCLYCGKTQNTNGRYKTPNRVEDKLPIHDKHIITSRGEGFYHSAPLEDMW
jgi:hypothetical protein